MGGAVLLWSKMNPNLVDSRDFAYAFRNDTNHPRDKEVCTEIKPGGTPGKDVSTSLRRVLYDSRSDSQVESVEEATAIVGC